MIIPAVVSLLVSTVFANFSLTIDGMGESLHDFYIERKGSVLGVMETVKEAPARINEAAGFTNSLPESLDLREPKRKTGSQALDLPIGSGLAIDYETDRPLWEKGSQEPRPIASISKLMTALVFLENNPGWDSVYTLSQSDFREGGKDYLLSGEKVKVRDLFYLSLIGSVNTATIALVNSTGLSEEDFIKKMNIKADELGLEKTNFSDPSGLSRFNVSTAHEVAKLAKKSFADPDIKEAVLKRGHSFVTIGGRTVRIESTDKLLDVFPANGISIIGGKTGYTPLAGACFVGEFVGRDGEKIISVILGGENIDDRFKYTKDLAEWVFASYSW